MTREHITLYELNKEVKSVLKNNLEQYYWVMGEISELKTNNSGHCYLELVEKDEETDMLNAKARAIIWSSAFRMLQPYFETTTGLRLTSGIKVLVKVTVEFHELYGYSLVISDIDPGYTIGELARKKQEVINRLTGEGVIDMNKAIPFPIIPQKIAVISSETAAGYGDFIAQLNNNPDKYKFYIKLFPAFMQGEEAEQSITAAFDRIYKYEEFFDLVVIIRGGGSQADLSCFNNYWLAYNITQFPIPVLTGIGHEQDESVVDIVAHTRLKTPTAVAEFLISKFQDAEDYVSELNNSIVHITREVINEEKRRISKCLLLLAPTVTKRISVNNNRLGVMYLNILNAAKKNITGRVQKIDLFLQNIKSLTREYIVKNSRLNEFLYKMIKSSLPNYLSNKKYQLEILKKKNHYLDPENILKLGYSVTYHNNKNIKSSAELKKDDIIQTILYKGKLKSKVLKK